jgi:hypothetical protein
VTPRSKILNEMGNTNCFFWLAKHCCFYFIFRPAHLPHNASLPNDFALAIVANIVPINFSYHF